MAKKPHAGMHDLSNFDVSMGAVLRVYFFFFRFARPYYAHLILISALMLVQIPVGQLSLFLVRDVTDQALLAVDRTIGERMNALVTILLAQAGFWFAGDMLWKFRELLNWYLFMKGTFDLRLAFHRHLHRLPLNFLRRRPPGEHLYRATSDIMTNHNDPFDLGLMGMVAWTVLPILETVYTLIWAGFFLYLVDPWLALAIALYAIPFSLAAHVTTGWQRKIGTQNAYMAAHFTAVARDSIGGLRTLKAMGKALFQRKKYVGTLTRAIKLRLRFALIAVLRNDVVLWGVRWTFTSLLYLYVTWQVIRGEATIGEWTATFLIVENARGPIERLVDAIQSIRIWTINGQRVMQTLTVEPTLEDRPHAHELGPIKGEIAFENVTLDYEEGKRALDGVTLTLQPGEVVGFVGPSGAGKSSLINALLRLYGLTRGSVRVDGHDIADVKLDSLLHQVALVPQSTFLYDGSIRENVLFGNRLATDEEVLEALEQAGAGPLLERLGGDLDYEVGDATTLSGGEKQRLGIARALVRRPKLLVLDEATANLDPITEDSVLRTLESLYPGRTVIVVAHRLKAVRNCDRIVVLDRGRVVDEGRHEDLIERGGWYARMWADQQSGKNLEAPLG